ncbi:MAG: 4-alpha-glucanotransferase, partial [Chromatocurvus sp.]
MQPEPDTQPEADPREPNPDAAVSIEPLAERASGVLLHITSLPSPWGVGDLGACAREFVRRLARAGQRYWQVLPLNPVQAVAEDSPFFSSSSMAGNPLLVDLAE